MENLIISKFRKWSLPFSRFAIFLIYFWFGILKVLGYSPANPLVDALLQQTMPWMTFSTFILFFGWFEVLIGILFLFPRFTRISVVLITLHLITTIMPLFLLTESSWQSFLIPTLEGQYIIKNVLIISAVMGIFAHTHILKKYNK